ncbi:energy transducer TonB family protein [Sphingomonas baiyangensis]|uniref:TonB C-terminal domain-containing protein n=1 Tax=Sphingomonas baiyangensis TaxID=2572576 RepID=A0A4V5PTX3_9SPHN|nr:energy transducer TonB [Sphingomonas baiyangensis]TKD51758.1 hypothetical protein FBR43_14095 [Sphingomonas baiyangensis]
MAQALARRQRVSVMGGVIALHALLLLLLFAARMAVPPSDEVQKVLATFDVTDTPPPAIIVEPPPPLPDEIEAAPRGPAIDAREARPTPPEREPLLIDAPPPPASIAVPSIVRLPVPSVAPEAPASGRGSAGLGAGGADGPGGGEGGGGRGGAGSGAGSGRSLVLAEAEWIRQPTGRQWNSVWPMEKVPGSVRKIGGYAVLRCTVLPDNRARDCTAMYEEPTGKGVGKAAVALSEHFRVRPIRADGTPHASLVKIPVTFRLRER